MDTRFYIIEDDEVIQDTLKKTIAKNHLGQVVGMAVNGAIALQELQTLQPNIVLIDLLLPNVDGISIVSRIKDKYPDMYFIMISEVTSQDMISKAYREGIEFFINKPINIIEVVSIIEKVREKLQMSHVIHSFETAFKNMNLYKNSGAPAHPTEHSVKTSIETILVQLGISGDAGTNDIVEILQYLQSRELSAGKHIYEYKMLDLYHHLLEIYQKQYGKHLNISALEQRIRRSIFKALDHLANIGLEDYGHETFAKYSSTLFEFKEVRAQMDYIRGKSYEKGKINVKKFIEGILIALKDNHNY